MGIKQEKWWSRRESNPGVKYLFCEALHVYLIFVFVRMTNEQTVGHRSAYWLFESVW